MVVADGPLLADMRSVTQTDVIDTWPSLAARAARKVVGAQRWSKRKDTAFQRAVARRGYDLTYVNTVVPAREIELVSQLGIPVICHVHELDFAVKQMVGESAMRKLIPAVSHFIAASQAVGDYLRDRWTIPESKVSVIHEFTTSPRATSRGSEERSRTRSELGVGDTEILVGSCGTLDWRKGADLFLQVARILSASLEAPRMKFVWVGANSSHPDTQRFLHDVKASGLDALVRVIEATAEPERYFRAMDVFALTSREDPFPLVMLEAAAAGLPVVCFAGSGGGPEFVKEDAGSIAPYLDVETFAARVLELARDGVLRRRLGDAGRTRVTSHYTIELQAPKLLALINRFAVAARRD
jgi:glycosyltransferase involved in cell wall biosynthesis